MLRSPRLLVAARILAGITQPELASAAGIAVSVLQAIEQGRSDPRHSTVLALLDTLKAYGVELASETADIAWGVSVIKGSKAEAEGLGNLQDGRANPSGSHVKSQGAEAQVLTTPQVAKRIGRGRPRKSQV